MDAKIEIYLKDISPNLSHKQINFLENLFIEQYDKGYDLAHNVMKQALFTSQAKPILEDILGEIKEEKEELEALSIGEMQNINMDNVLDQLIDRFFSKRVEHIPYQKLELYDVQQYRDIVLQKSLQSFELGLRKALGDWCRKELTNMSGEFLTRYHQTPANIKTETAKPLLKQS